jgi:hypothetical protein
MGSDNSSTTGNAPETLGRGRPTVYQDDFPERARIMCEAGATDIELADEFGVNVLTIYRWKHKYPEFCKSLLIGKDIADDRVERSFYNRAVGYTFEATKIFMPSGADQPVYAPYFEHVPPDHGAALSWLKNRRGDKWRDKTETDINIKGDLGDLLAERRAKVAALNAGE